MNFICYHFIDNNDKFQRFQKVPINIFVKSVTIIRAD